MPAPVFFSAGAFTSGTAALTVPVPAGFVAGDVFLLFVESANEVIATPAGWTQVANSPQGTGTAAAAGGVRLAVFWKVTAASEASVTVADSGNHTTAQIMLFKGCDTVNPIHVTAGGVQATASTNWTLPSVTTTIVDTLIVFAIAQDADLNATTGVTSYTNAGLGSITERTDNTINSGAGGGLAVATVTDLTAGATGTTAVVSANSTTAAFLTIALRPKVELFGSGPGPQANIFLPGQLAWAAVAFGNGVWVAVPNTTSAIGGASRDGITWTTTTLPSAQNYYRIAYGNGVFVAPAVLSTVSIVSSNGVDWTAGTLPTGAGNWAAIAYGNGVFAAIKNGSSVAATSTNGTAWTARTLPSVSAWVDIAYGNGVFVAVSSASPTPVAATSPDGITWTARSPGIGSGGFQTITFGNGIFLAVAADGSSLITSDGVTWFSRSLPPGSYNWAAFGEGIFAVSGNNIIAFSRDATLWDTRTLAGNIWGFVGYAGDAFFTLTQTSSFSQFRIPLITPSASVKISANLSTLAVGAELVDRTTGTNVITLGNGVAPGDVAVVMAFRDGSNVPPSAPSNPLELLWVTRGLPVSGTARTPAFGNGVYVIVYGSTNIALSSTDTNNWTQRSLPASANWSAVAYGNGVFVAVVSGGSSVAATSTDGITWTQRTMPSSQSWVKVVYGAGLFLATTISSAVTATSPDGITWTQRALPASGFAEAVIYNDGLFVVFHAAAAYTSPDAINWTQRTLPASESWKSIAYGNGVFIAVGGPFTNVAVSSPDGITWTQRTLPATSGWAAITFCSGVFFASYNADIGAVSTDGITWTQRQLNYRNRSAAASINGAFLIPIGGYFELEVAVPGVLTTLDASGPQATSSSLLAYKTIPIGGAQSIGPFTDATSVVAAVYRGLDPVNPIPNFASSSGVGTSVTVPAHTSSATSFAVCFAAHQSVDIAWPGERGDWTNASGASNGVVINVGVDFGAGRWVISSFNNSIFRSDDAFVTIATSTSPFAGTAAIYTVFYGGGLWVVGNDEGRIGTSTDGITWVERTSPIVAANKQIRGGAFGNGAYVLSCNNGGTSARSTDGVTWSSITTTLGAFLGRAVTYDNGLFVMVGDGNQISTSPDGITWTARTSSFAPGTSIQGIAYGNGLWCAVTNGGFVATSPDAITWTSRTGSWGTANARNLMFDRGWFVVSGDSGFMAVSENGSNWVSITSGFGTTPINDVAFGNDRWVAVGDTGRKFRLTFTPRLVRRGQEIDATDAVVVLDSAGVAQ